LDEARDEARDEALDEALDEVCGMIDKRVAAFLLDEGMEVVYDGG
jgi:hypothetical protein